MKLDIKRGYAAARAAAYPSVEEQLDMLYNQGFDSWRASIRAVKEKYPKTPARPKEQL